MAFRHHQAAVSYTHLDVYKRQVQQGAHHVAGEAVLVVVPRNGTSHGHAVNGVDVGLGRIEHATVGVADDVGRYDAILVVAVERCV